MEIVSCFRAILAFAKYLTSDPRIHMVAHLCGSSSRESNTLLWSPQAQGMHMVHSYACQQTLTHKIKNIPLKDPMELQVIDVLWVYCVWVTCYGTEFSGEMQHCHSLILMLNRTVFQMCVLTKPIYPSTIFNE